MSDLRHADGGTAFPITTVFNPHSGEFVNTGHYWDGNGMSLRDWFAGMALPLAWESEHAPHLPGIPTLHLPGIPTLHGVAHKAYQIADAMLQERMKPKP